MRPAWMSPLYEPTTVSLGGLVTLTNIGSTYDATAPARGLGIARVDMTGVTSLELVVGVNKVGTGVQSWQVWNETDGAELAVIDDAGAAGNKILTTTVAVMPMQGMRTLRLRAKSSVAADDPVYYGSSIALS